MNRSSLVVRYMNSLYDRCSQGFISGHLQGVVISVVSGHMTIMVIREQTAPIPNLWKASWDLMADLILLNT